MVMADEDAVLMDMSIDPALELIKSFEGFKAKAYKCPAGIWTIGYGRTSSAGAEVGPSSVTTRAKEDEWLKKSLYERASYVRQKALNRTVGETLNPNQVAALISLIYNIGEGNFSTSGVRRFLLQGKIDEAMGAWARWNKAGGIILSGLTRRREAEISLFKKPY